MPVDRKFRKIWVLPQAEPRVQSATNEYIVLLNNDVRSDGRLAYGHAGMPAQRPDVGIVGPMTNRISGIQQVPAVGYSQLESSMRMRKPSAYAIDTGESNAAESSATA